MAIANIDVLIDSEFNFQRQPNMVPPPIIRLPKTSAESDSRQVAAVIGNGALRDGRIGVLLVAGGAGTRLGFPHPKGMYPIGPVSDRSFFHLFAGQVLALSKRHHRTIPLLVMTSEETHEEIVRFFEVHDWFGLDPLNVFLFPQGTHPVLDTESGCYMQDKNGRSITSADGHGGAVAALENRGLFGEMKRRGVETLFYHQVDNPLVEICDPVFIGFHMLHASEASTKVVCTKSPEEKVGIVAEVDGQLRVFEYSELPPAVAGELGPTGDLLFSAANTAIHLFQLDFLERLAATPDSLPWHRVERRVACVTPNDVFANREYVDAIKLERFIFDVLPRAQNAILVEIDRELEFSPLKNAEGDCSPPVVRKAMSMAANLRLRDAGVLLPEDLAVEIDSGILADEPLCPRLLQAPWSGQSIIIQKDDALQHLAKCSTSSQPRIHPSGLGA